MKTIRNTLTPLAVLTTSLLLNCITAHAGDSPVVSGQPKPATIQTIATQKSKAAAPATPRNKFAGGRWRNGETLFQENCARCHGPNLQGRMMAPSLLGVTKRMTDEAIVAHARKIGATMCCARSILNLSDAEFGDILAFLHAMDSSAAVRQQVAQLGNQRGCGCSMMVR